MQKITIQVSGMKCGMCEAHVSDVLRRQKGVKKAESSHTKGESVVIAEDGIDLEALKEAIKGQGYDVGEAVAEPYEKKGFFSSIFKK